EKSSWPGVSSRLKVTPSFSKVITLEVTEIPRCCSIFIQSGRARRAAPRALTSPARWIAPPCSRSFSVSVVLPASGCEMIAKVRRVEGILVFLPPARGRGPGGSGMGGGAAICRRPAPPASKEVRPPAAPGASCCRRDVRSRRPRARDGAAARSAALHLFARQLARLPDLLGELRFV